MAATSSNPDKMKTPTTCLDCDHTHVEMVHKKDSGDVLPGFYCPNCEDVTRHRVGSPRWFK